MEGALLSSRIKHLHTVFFQYRTISAKIGQADFVWHTFFPIQVEIDMHRTGLYWHASDWPISACIGSAYIGMCRIDLYRHVPLQIEVNYSADAQMKDKIIITLFDFYILPNILKILEKPSIPALF